MKKICSNCNMQIDATPDETRCPECGGMLVNDTLQPMLDLPLRSGMQMDNSIHKGDNIGEIHNGNELHVGGDNAESIDKSTTINNTTYAVYQPKDEGRKMVVCEYSGANVYLSDTFECVVCHRHIDRRFYVDKDNCCKECSDKKEAARKKELPSAPVNSTQDKDRRQEQIPAASRQREQAPSAEKVASSGKANQPVPDRTGTKGGQKQNGGIYKYVLVAVLLGGAVVWYMGLQDNKTEDAPQQAELAEQGTISDEAVKEGVSLSPSPKSKTQTALSAPPQTGKAEKTETADNDNAPVSSMKEGESAYNSGNYSKAKIFLQQASEEGKAAANYYLALMYSSGKGVSVDTQKAFAYMRKAAEGGEKRAFFLLAEMYRNGDGTEANRAQAKKWYERTVVLDSNHAEQASQILEVYE